MLKVPPKQVVEIRRRRKQGETQRALAKEFDVSEAVLSSVINGRRGYETLVKKLCALCRQQPPILSHIIPGYIHRRLSRGGKTIYLSWDASEEPFVDNSHIKELLLCVGCDNRLERCGEYKAISKGYDPVTNRSRWYEQGIQHPVADGLCLGQDTFGSELDHLAYFGVSMFWRFSVSRHPWFLDFSLGQKYEDLFGAYLLGGPFPASQYLFIQVQQPIVASDAMALLPACEQMGTWRCYAWATLGLRYKLLVGQQIPTAYKHCCVMNGEKRPVFIERSNEADIRLSDLVGIVQRDLEKYGDSR
jgi:hypothetical protein